MFAPNQTLCKVAPPAIFVEDQAIFLMLFFSFANQASLRSACGDTCLSLSATTNKLPCLATGFQPGLDRPCPFDALHPCTSAR